jgi:hypothetical protein
MTTNATPKRISVRKAGTVRLTLMCRCPYSIFA